MQCQGSNVQSEIASLELLPGGLQDFTVQCYLESGRRKLSVNFSTLQKCVTLMVLSDGGFTLNRRKWHVKLPRKTTPSQTTLPTGRVSAQNEVFGGFY